MPFPRPFIQEILVTIDLKDGCGHSAVVFEAHRNASFQISPTLVVLQNWSIGLGLLKYALVPSVSGYECINQGLKMTAIIAYAEPGFAFLAADSCRTVTTGTYHQAVKVYSWSDKVLFAQAGNVAQQFQMIFQMLAGRGIAHLHNMAGFEHAWQSCRPHWAAIAVSSHASDPSIPIDGTILVADAESGEVKLCDFASGSISQVTPFGAAGFPTVNAAATTAWGAGRRDLDMWAVDTISSLCGPSSGIDWPIDLMIFRSDMTYERTISIRLDDLPTASRSDFLLP